MWNALTIHSHRIHQLKVQNLLLLAQQKIREVWGRKQREQRGLGDNQSRSLTHRHSACDIGEEGRALRTPVKERLTNFMKPNQGGDFYEINYRKSDNQNEEISHALGSLALGRR
ncbi:uncharacterized protein LOC104416010 [Eucalyptus grandis]|uniref:uncharacterized protein LOC104416010 n=1 Tax=Eucalyptus grandis TaxID=71139 RepID=UPI00192E84EE|nr:uncharacterized protein LOC104416010 [Eucalyptus grandis]